MEKRQALGLLGLGLLATNLFGKSKNQSDEVINNLPADKQQDGLRYKTAVLSWLANVSIGRDRLLQALSKGDGVPKEEIVKYIVSAVNFTSSKLTLIDKTSIVTGIVEETFKNYFDRKPLPPIDEKAVFQQLANAESKVVFDKCAAYIKATFDYDKHGSPLHYILLFNTQPYGNYDFPTAKEGDSNDQVAAICVARAIIFTLLFPGLTPQSLAPHLTSAQLQQVCLKALQTTKSGTHYQGTPIEFIEKIVIPGRTHLATWEDVFKFWKSSITDIVTYQVPSAPESTQPDGSATITTDEFIKALSLLS